MDKQIAELAVRTDHRILATWAPTAPSASCRSLKSGLRKMTDHAEAIEATVRGHNGIFRMADVRKASLSAHAAAREVEEDDAARSAARSAVKRWQQRMFPDMPSPLAYMRPLPSITPPIPLRPSPPS